jgi:hypothetical protein
MFFINEIVRESKILRRNQRSLSNQRLIDFEKACLYLEQNQKKMGKS